jgi:hypothetical protein
VCVCVCVCVCGCVYVCVCDLPVPNQKLKSVSLFKFTNVSKLFSHPISRFLYVLIQIKISNTMHSAAFN